MQLLELEFENFKSFKGHVTVPFGPGFTCITGPNGSGKSNITDAILFILGSRSTKLLRARRLNQLIFGFQEGKKSRSAAKHCRVSMVFDNSDRFLSIESDRVRFTKGVRLRGGKPATYYRLNGDTSSAGEFEALFSRAGLYATGYNIIQQGDVMQTSLMSGTERRRKLEDVAGITAYDQRLRKTRSAREHVGADLTLLDERMREAQRLLRQLEREKRDAERLEAILQQLQENALQRKWRRVLDLEAELESRRGLIVRHEKELEELVGELEERQTVIGVLEDSYKKVEEEISDAGGDRARELQEQLDKARVEQALAQSNSESADARLVELEVSRRQLGDARKAAAAELKELRDALDAARAGADELEAQVTTAASELARLEASAADGSQEISGQRDALDALRQAAGEL
nr:AAA family ATPase [Candidatus Poseidoniia archaeon]